MIALTLFGSGCANDQKNPRVMNVSCEGTYHYTGLIGTSSQFTDSSLVTDLEYTFDFENRIITKTYLDLESPYCDLARECSVNFGERLVTGIRGDEKDNRIWSSSLSFDRTNMTLRMMQAASGSLSQWDLVCSNAGEGQ
ncbi:hypothetical protein [Erythrobacter dokdonensis]|uniref:hypothetical protein n=1 Tax=Erythrobacter dokdonensis TaxID=328225 RepID=UPI00118133BE|nr:hypothetical protein [Erythrobacter dokdonensis]